LQLSLEPRQTGAVTRISAKEAGLLDKLEFLLALAQEKHFGRAADSCGVTQPTLSAGLKQLEEALGVLLVNRGSRFHGFTPEGQRVLDWARRIVGDTRAMRQEVTALRHGLAGRLRIAAIPSALATVAALTTPYRAKHPNVQFTILSRTSTQILALLENLEIDAGLTYLDNEPLGRVNTVPLYKESYRLLTAAAAPLGNRKKVAWSELSQLPLCLLTPDLQTRRIIDGLLPIGKGERRPTLESDSTILLLAHVRTGQWASILPAKIAQAMGPIDPVRAIPIVEPDAVHTIGLVIAAREPMTPLSAALVAEARRIAASPGL
jgi:DNA-binding transcriptional LysR family regulator